MPTLKEKFSMRRRFVVDRRFQFALLLRSIAFTGFVFLVMSAALFVPLIRGVGVVAPDGSAEEMRIDRITAFLYMHEHFWPAALVCMGLAALGSLRQSHRIAGPMVRVKRYLNAVANGYLPGPLRTRKRDYLKCEVDALNDMIARLGEKIAAIKGAEERIRATLEQCGEMATAHHDAEVRATLDALITHSGTLHTAVRAFRREEDPESEVVSDPITPMREAVLS